MFVFHSMLFSALMLLLGNWKRLYSACN